jgi:hypothetical protein
MRCHLVREGLLILPQASLWLVIVLSAVTWLSHGFACMYDVRFALHGVT